MPGPIWDLAYGPGTGRLGAKNDSVLRVAFSLSEHIQENRAPMENEQSSLHVLFCYTH